MHGVSLFEARWKRARAVLTKFVLGTRLELLIRHELFDAPREGGNVVDDQLIQIGELLSVDDELRTDVLTGRVGVRLYNIWVEDDQYVVFTLERRTYQYADRAHCRPST